MPPNTGLIAVIAASAGVGYVIYKRMIAAKAAPVPLTCEQKCASIPDVYGARSDCIIACGAATVLSALDVHPQDNWKGEVARRVAVNAMNGAALVPTIKPSPDGPRVPYISGARVFENGNGAYNNFTEVLGNGGVVDTLMSTLNGDVARYENGCEPFYGAPGWSKCKTGTLDMYGSAISSEIAKTGGLGHDYFKMGEESLRTTRVYATGRQAADAAAAMGSPIGDPDSVIWQYWESMGFEPKFIVPSLPVRKQNFMTGAGGDPMTMGAGKTAYGPKEITPTDQPGLFMVRGQMVTMELGKVPRAIAMQLVSPTDGSTTAQITAAIVALTDQQAIEPVDIATFTNELRKSTRGDCATIVGSGLTWDVAGKSWRRMRAGEVQNIGPCAASDKFTAVSIGGNSGRVIEGI